MGWSSTPFFISPDMKKIFIAFLMAAALVLTTSCTDESKAIVGTWYASEMKLKIDKKTNYVSLSDYN